VERRGRNTAKRLLFGVVLAYVCVLLAAGTVFNVGHDEGR
jgi:hypothetical protein